MNNAGAFNFKPFSRKQKQLLTWWMPESPHSDCDMVIAAGSVRSGKTVAMIDGFLMWSLSSFEHETFILAGKSIGALRRNVIRPLTQILAAKGIPYKYRLSDNCVEIGTNTYHCFGGNDESSQDVLQGFTAAGALADEAALLPWSFIEQMFARCSVDGAKLWLNCNPESPHHPVKTELIDKAESKNVLHLHFTMDDNLTLSERVKDRFRRMFAGVWFKRFVLGLWVAAEGAIYDMLDESVHVVDELPEIDEQWITCDYGTTNPSVFLLCGQGADGNYYVIDEYRHDSRQTGRQKTDSQYSADLQSFIDRHKACPSLVIVDPSAASFITQLRSDNLQFPVQAADNAVLDGIRRTSMLFDRKKLFIHRRCTGLLSELSGYVWDDKAQERGEDSPVKVNDHGPDALRYFVNTVIGHPSPRIRWISDAGPPR